MKNLENTMNPERKSCQKISLWMDTYENPGVYKPLGEIRFEGDSFIVKGEEPGDEGTLRRELSRMARPLRGIPVFKHQNGEIVRDENNKFIIEKYINHKNSQPDEMIEAVYDYFRALGVYKVKLEAV